MARTSEEIKATARAAGNPAAIREQGREQGLQPGLTGDPLTSVNPLVNIMLASRRAARDRTETTSAEEHLEPVAEGVEELEAAGEEHLEGERGVTAENVAEAKAKEEEMEASRAEAAAGFDKADVATEEGLEHIQGEIATTRDVVDSMPDRVSKEFDRRGEELDAGLEKARTGLGEMRGEALANVMSGQSKAMDAAVAGIHGTTRQQIADIDAQVQQGMLSPSQAQAMKSRIRMGASMQLSAAVGQTIHAFTQTEAQTAASFGQFFSSLEGIGVQAVGQFGATAAGTFGQTVQVSGQLNTTLTGMDVQAMASRDARLSQNAGARGAFVNAGDTNSIAMMDYTQDTYVSPIPMAINNLTARTDLAHDYIKSDEFERSIAILMRNMDETQANNFIQGIFGLAELVLPG